mmetsp:Transcript_968/g.2738  ORF Transcript_968/g.2738 Transcript_968/m.2738 type:complete len:294 (-) Transcript_968:51-932(-)
MKDSLADLPVVDGTVGELAQALSVRRVLGELPLEDAAIGALLPPDAVIDALGPLPLVDLARGVRHPAAAVHDVALELALVDVPLPEDEEAAAVARVGAELALVGVPGLRVLVAAAAAAPARGPLPGVGVPVGVAHGARAVVAAPAHVAAEDGAVAVAQRPGPLVQQQAAAPPRLEAQERALALLQRPAPQVEALVGRLHARGLGHGRPDAGRRRAHGEAQAAQLLAGAAADRHGRVRPGHGLGQRLRDALQHLHRPPVARRDDGRLQVLISQGLRHRRAGQPKRRALVTGHQR